MSLRGAQQHPIKLRVECRLWQSHQSTEILFIEITLAVGDCRGRTSQ